MKDIATKVNGDTYDATEFNGFYQDVKNAILSAGIALSSGDLFQLAQTMATYSSAGYIYEDSGAADAYVLSASSVRQPIKALVDGLRIRFRADNVNTGASTINLAGLGVKSAVDEDGGALIGGEISATLFTSFEYVLASDHFRLVNAAKRVIAGTNNAIVTLDSLSNPQDSTTLLGTEPNNALVLDGDGEILSANMPSGSILQTVYAETTANTTSILVIPFDGTTPQNTEGTEALTLAITPLRDDSFLLIEAVFVLGCASSSANGPICLFQDSIADALAVTVATISGTNHMDTVPLAFRHQVASTTARTYKIRFGTDDAGRQIILNGNGTGGPNNTYGVSRCVLKITEIAN